jgi:hypothetical protein
METKRSKGVPWGFRIERMMATSMEPKSQESGYGRANQSPFGRVNKMEKSPGYAVKDCF